jgi:uncharacterized protein
MEQSMYSHLIKEKILDFQRAELYPLTPREYEIVFIDGMSFSITGPRRSGKTFRTYQFVADYTAQGKSIENICRIQFNDHKLIKLKSEDLGLIDDTFYALYPEKKQNNEEIIFIFDEIHRIDGWEDYILYLLENRNHKIIITGSTSKLQKGEIASALRGKNFDRELLPFSFREYMKHHGHSCKAESSNEKAFARKLFDKYMHEGSFPGLLNVTPTAHDELLNNYWDTMLIRDIVEANSLKEKIDILQLERFALYLISRTACPMTVRKIIAGMKNDGYTISSAKAYSYLKYMEDAFMFFCVQYYSLSEKIRRCNYTKVYSIDWKLADTICAGGNIDITRQFENMIYLELRRQQLKISYFKTRDGFEVDFVTTSKKGGSSPDLYQVCYDISASEVLERELRAIEKSYIYLNAASATIITLEEEKIIKIKHNISVNIIPAWKWLLSFQHRASIL